jgi:enoyl-CoA hydratase
MAPPVGLDVEDGVATVTIDAPPVNALTLDAYEALTAAFESVAARDDVRCVIVTSAGSRAFCAGLDLHEFLATPPDQDDHRQRTGLATFTAVDRCPVPVIAAVNGHALGAGIVLASLCDIRVASDRATFGLPEINVGRCGGAAFVGRLIPQGIVRLMFFTGEPISANEAHRVGLVDMLTRPRELMPTAIGLARTIASKSPMGVRLGKRALNESEHLPPMDGYRVEQRYSAELVQTHDSREALRAVVEKRAPVFLGE